MLTPADYFPSRHQLQRLTTPTTESVSSYTMTASSENSRLPDTVVNEDNKLGGRVISLARPFFSTERLAGGASKRRSPPDTDEAVVETGLYPETETETEMRTDIAAEKSREWDRDSFREDLLVVLKGWDPRVIEEKEMKGGVICPKTSRQIMGGFSADTLHL